MKNRWITITAAMALCLFLLDGLEAQPRTGERPYRGERQQWDQGSPRAGRGAWQQFRPGERGFAFLDLSEEQKEELSALRLEHYKAVKPLRNQMGELRARKRTLMSEEEVDMKALHSVIDDQAEVMKDLQKLKAGHRLEMRSVLTDEQVMKLEQRRRHASAMRRGPRHR